MTFTWPVFLRKCGLFCLISALIYFPVFQPMLWGEMVGAFYVGLPLFGLVQGAFAHGVLGRVLNASLWRTFLAAFVLTGAIGIVFTLAGLESAACLIMGMPLVAPAQLVGIILARRYDRKYPTLYVSTLVLCCLRHWRT